MDKNSLERGMMGRSSPENKNHQKAVWWIKAHRTKTRWKEVWWAEADETKTHWKMVWRIKVIWTKKSPESWMAVKTHFKFYFHGRQKLTGKVVWRTKLTGHKNSTEEV